MSSDQIIPGTGWEVSFKLDTPRAWTEPVVAWRSSEGRVEALICGPMGEALPVGGDGVTTRVHPAGEGQIPIARLVTISPSDRGWDFEVRCPRCMEIHLHGAGNEKTYTAFLAVLGKRAAHCPRGNFTYVMGDPDGVIMKHTPSA